MKKMLVKIFMVATLVATASNASECLKLGLIPAEDPKSMLEQYKPMAKWLEKEIGQCIELKTSTDYTGVIEAMRAKKVDIAWFGPFSYAMAAERADAEAFAVGMDAKGKTTYTAYLISTPEVIKELGVDKTLVGSEGMQILKNKLEARQDKYLMAFTDIASTSGYAAPRYYMYKAGIDPKKNI